MQHKVPVHTNDMNLLLDISLPGVETIPACDVWNTAGHVHELNQN